MVTNLGPNAATDVQVQDILPTGLSFVATTGDCTTAFACALGTLLPGQARTISVRFALLSGAPPVVSNTATVSSSTPDPAIENNSATAITPAVALTYYFAEGATGTFWDCDLLFANPSDNARASHDTVPQGRRPGRHTDVHRRCALAQDGARG